MSDDEKPPKRQVETAPLPLYLMVEPLPFIRPNPLLYPQGPKRRPTPPSFEGLPFTARLDDAAANDKSSGAGSGRTGEMVPYLTDGPFALCAPVVSLRPPAMHLCLIAKLSCDLVDGDVATIRQEAVPLDGDIYLGDEPDAPLLVASDFAPVKESCDVLIYDVGADVARRQLALQVNGRGGAVDRRVKEARALAAISPQDPARLAHLGTYDAKWFATRWPHYAEDLDVRHFQAAPAGQRLAQAFGDESFRFTDTHDPDACFRGKLPGLRPVAVARLAGGELKKLSLRLDTVSFFAGERRADLVWRGLLEVSADDAPEVEEVFVTWADVDEGLADEEVALRFEAARRAKAGDESEPESTPLDDGVAVEPEAEEEAEETEAERAANEEAIAEAAKYPAKTPAELAEMMRSAGADEDDIAEMMAAVDPSPAPPMPSEANDVRAEVIRRLEAKESLEGLELMATDLSELDLSQQNLSGFDLSGTNLAGANLSEATLDDAELSGARLAAANLRGASAKAAQLVGVDLTAACCEEADFAEADFTEALLDGAVFDNANMVNVRLYDVRAPNASFRRANMTNARAEAALMDGSTLDEAVLDESVWEKASFQKAKLVDASMVAVSLVRANCDGASFARADLTDARLGKASMVGVVMTRANLFEANLDRADFTRADLRGANLHAISNLDTKLQGALLGGAITSYSRLGEKTS